MIYYIANVIAICHNGKENEALWSIAKGQEMRTVVIRELRTGRCSDRLYTHFCLGDSCFIKDVFVFVFVCWYTTPFSHAMMLLVKLKLITLLEHLRSAPGFVWFALLSQYNCALYITVSPISFLFFLVITLSILLRFTTFNYPFISYNSYLFPQQPR
jgi:hypothetical protein